MNEPIRVFNLKDCIIKKDLIIIKDAKKLMINYFNDNDIKVKISNKIITSYHSVSYQSDSDILLKTNITNMEVSLHRHWKCNAGFTIGFSYPSNKVVLDELLNELNDWFHKYSNQFITEYKRLNQIEINKEYIQKSNEAILNEFKQPNFFRRIINYFKK